MISNGNHNVNEKINEAKFYQALSDYIDEQEQLNCLLQTKLDDLKKKLKSIEYTWREGRFDSVYHCIVCGKTRPNGHSSDCWLNSAINHK